MKFTKQEQSLIKLAAAHMAPQMLKKAALQDKLAEYGIGMAKKAAGEWTVPALPTTGVLQAAQPPEYWSKELGHAPALQAQAEWSRPLSGKTRLLNAIQNYVRRAGRPAQMGALAGYTVGSALRGAQPQQSQSADAARGAINEIKTNGWPSVGMGPYSLKQIQAKRFPLYGNRIFQSFANLAKNPEALNDSIVKMNREGAVPDTRRSDSTGLMSGNGRALSRILAPGNTSGR